MAKIEKIGNIQIVDNKEDKFFYFPMISMACTGSRYPAAGCQTDCIGFQIFFLPSKNHPQKKHRDHKKTKTRNETTIITL